MRKSEQVGVSLQRRRLRAGRLLLRGVSQAEVARRVGVTRRTVCDWSEKLNAGGLQPPQRRVLIGYLQEGALARGFSCQRPSGRALERNEAAIQRWIIIFIDES